jgi:glycosyltransferase involved in cell wall biosynthesis
MRFTFIPLTALERSLRRVPGLWYLAYNLWHRRAFRAARELHAEVGFDLAHQVTLSGFREPGYLWKLGVPFVWGPVGGVQNYPWRFLAQAGLRGALEEGLRNVGNFIQFRFSPRVGRAARAASVLLAGNSVAQRGFERVHHVRSVLMPNVGAVLLRQQPRPRAGKAAPLRLLWSGLLEPHKGLRLLLAALGELPLSLEWELRIVGRGSRERALRRLARRLGIAERCMWVGWLPHDQALCQYDWADLFVLTSLRDTSPTVLMEALGHGVPVLCLDHQGAGDVVTPECGLKVPVTSPREVISGIRDAVALAAREPELLGRLGRGAFERAKEYLWSAQGDRIARLYVEARARSHREDAGE